MGIEPTPESWKLTILSVKLRVRVKTSRMTLSPRQK